MAKLIPEIDKITLRKELSPDRYIGNTNKLENEIYIIDGHNAPNILREIGRLRELSFGEAGGGTGKALDIDEYDTSERCYSQMIIYSPKDQEIVGGYRFIKCPDAFNPETQKFELSTLHYFDFSVDFIKNYLPKTIELGRSWIQPKYQSKGGSKRQSIFALDNLWDGLGAIIHANPDIAYLFGKVTMYPTYQKEARDFLLRFMHFYFPDNQNLVTPKSPIAFTTQKADFDQLFEGKAYKKGHMLLNKFVRLRGEGIPPLINSYMNLSATMKTFGSAKNDDFGQVEETGILITIADLHQAKRDRYIGQFSQK